MPQSRRYAKTLRSMTWKNSVVTLSPSCRELPREGADAPARRRRRRARQGSRRWRRPRARRSIPSSRPGTAARRATAARASRTAGAIRAAGRRGRTCPRRGRAGSTPSRMITGKRKSVSWVAANAVSGAAKAERGEHRGRDRERRPPREHAAEERRDDEEHRAPIDGAHAGPRDDAEEHVAWADRGRDHRVEGPDPLGARHDRPQRLARGAVHRGRGHEPGRDEREVRDAVDGVLLHQPADAEPERGEEQDRVQDVRDRGAAPELAEDVRLVLDDPRARASVGTTPPACGR